MFLSRLQATAHSIHALTRRRPGYAFLVGVMAIGAIAASTTVSMILLGLASQQNGATALESAQAWENAQTCIERALRSLKTDLQYVGDTTLTLAYGTCTLLPIGGSGNRDRHICAEGLRGNNLRRVEVTVEKIFPTTVIEDWQEVFEFSSACR